MLANTVDSIARNADIIVDTELVRPKSSYGKSAQLMKRRAKSSMPSRPVNRDENDCHEISNTLHNINNFDFYSKTFNNR
jgi:hypothetical protein